MRGTLKISDTLSLPISSATQTFAFIARKGAGKTFAAGKLTELLLERKVQVIILDTVGNWYGLRIAANGKDKGFDIPVFGGLRGDLPLQASAGELVADIVVDTGRSLILDISQFSLSERRRFAASFGERLWKKKKAETRPTPVMLVIEESQLIVPQNIGANDKDAARMLGIYEEIIRLGRNYGIGAMMISQRPQSVNKEVLNQTECLFVLQVNGAQERKALKLWIVHQGMDVKLLDELPSLPIGTAYVWSPQWLGILKKIKIAPKTTFDSSATPKVGNKVVRRNPAPLDLHEIEERMSALVEQAKQNDPRALQQQVLELQRQLNVQSTRTEVKTEIQTIVERVEVPVLNGEVKELKGLFNQFNQSLGVLQTINQTLVSVGNVLQTTNTKIDQVINYKPALTYSSVKPALKGSLDVRPVVLPVSPKAPIDTSGLKLRAGERQILQVLKQFHPEPLTDVKIRLLAGFNFSRKTYDTYKSVLKNKDLVMDSADGLFLTDAGYKFIGEVEVVPHTTEELYGFWSKRLRAGENAILRTGIDVYPRWAELEQMREKLPQLSQKSFETYVSILRGNNLIDVEQGKFRASGSFFAY